MDNTTDNETDSGGGSMSPYTKSEQGVIGFILFSIVAISLLGNILVIIAVMSFRRLRDNVTNYFIISLAFSDLMVAIFVMPYNAVHEVLGYWPFGIVFCDIYQSLDILCCTASILNLCVISLDRYLAIISPFTYYERITKNTSLVLIALVWVVSFFISAFPVILDFHEDPSLDGWYNDPMFCILTLHKVFALVSSIISFYIPVIVILFVYASIFVVARRQARQIAAYENTAKRFAGENKKSMARERKAAKTLSIIVGVFIVCWLPFFTINIIDPFCGRCLSPELFAVFVWLGFVNSALNPIIYAQNKNFRRAFKSLLCCYKCKGIHVRDTDTSDAEQTQMAQGTYKTKADAHTTKNGLSSDRTPSRQPSPAATTTTTVPSLSAAVAAKSTINGDTAVVNSSGDNQLPTTHNSNDNTAAETKETAESKSNGSNVVIQVSPEKAETIAD